MPIRTQLRLPQISGSLKDNTAEAFVFTEGSTASEKKYLVFDTRNSQEMVNISDVDLRVGTGNIRLGNDLSLFDASNHERIAFGDASNILLKNQAGNATVVDVADGGISITGTASTTGDLTVGGHIVADGDEAKNIFAAVTTAGNAITLGGGAAALVLRDPRTHRGSRGAPFVWSHVRESHSTLPLHLRDSIRPMVGRAVALEIGCTRP